MSEQNPKQNIIRFPLSRRERRQRLLDSKDARIRTTALLRMLCGWALVLGTALFLIANYRIFTPTSLRTLGSYIAAGIRSHDGDITTINYENETFSDGALFESGLAYADSDALFLSRAGSMTTLRYSLGYSDPAVESSTNHVLVYDRGGVKAALAGSAAAGVYDTAGKEVFKYRASEYYIVSAVLSPDCNTLGILAFRQNGVTLESHVLFFDVSSGKQISDTALTDALGVTLTYSENNAAIALCDTGLYHVTRRGTVDVLLELSSQDLIATASQGSTMAVAVRSYLNDARSDLYTVRNGSLHGPFALTEEPTALAVSNAGTAVLSASGVTVYNTSAEPQWHNDDAVGARRVLMTDDGTVFLLYNRNARIFTAHSERSEEIHADN